MMAKLLKRMTPRNRKDCVVKGAMVLGVIITCNIVFYASLGLAAMPSLAVLFWNSVFVGGPWVALFFWAMADQVDLQKRLATLSRTDGLTGLNNRRAFIELADRRSNTGQGGVLLMLDADNFKHVNDRYGHATGDACLKAISRCLERNMRGTDILGRIGGEEFAIFLTGANIEQAKAVATRFIVPIPFKSHDNSQSLSITLSVGAVIAMPSNTLDQLLVRADEALYAAKTTGRAKVVVWKSDKAAKG